MFDNQAASNQAAKNQAAKNQAAKNQAANNWEDTRADRALSVGLTDLLTSEPSADFETRILAALAPRTPWWQTAWIAARPAVPTAIGALAVMLWALHLAPETPVGAPVQGPSLVAHAKEHRNLHSPAGIAVPQGASPEASSRESIDNLDNIDLNSTTLSFLSHPMRRILDRRG